MDSMTFAECSNYCMQQSLAEILSSSPSNVVEQTPSFVQKLSLEELALRRIAVNLWTEQDILDSIAKIQCKLWEYNESTKSWTVRMISEGDLTVEKKVKDKISKLFLPESFKKELLYIVKPIGLQIQTWKMFHEDYLTEVFDASILEKLCWTSAGTVSYKETAEELIRCEMLDSVKRYRLACLYCLEEGILAYWKEVDSKNNISTLEMPSLDHSVAYNLKEQLSKLDKRFEIEIKEPDIVSDFRYSSAIGNQAAAEYLFHKLPNEERHVNLFEIANSVLSLNPESLEVVSLPIEKRSEVLSYLLSLMTPQQRTVIFRESPCSILSYFMYWPWQDLFLEIARITWTFLPERSYDILVSRMNDSLRRSGYYLPKAFQEFFIHSPIAFKKCFLNEECQCGRFFHKFFELQDIETIEVILKNIDVADRVKLMSASKYSEDFDQLKLKDKWLYSSADTI